MLRRMLAPSAGLPVETIERRVLFVVLAVTVAASTVLARTTAETLFLGSVGVRSIPIYFLVLGLASAPAAALIARLIDRRPRLLLLREFLFASALLALLLRSGWNAERPIAAFAVLTSLVLVEMLLYIQFWVLVADYFTTLEQKRVVTWLSAAMAVGGLMGGGLVHVLAQSFGVADLLLILPVFYGVAVLLLAKLRRTHQPLDVSEAYREASLVDSLRSAVDLVGRFPVVGWLALAGFAEILIGGLSGYLIYGLYERSFPSETRLATFLGVLNAVLALLEVVVSWLLAGPLIKRLGVGWMSLFLPLTTFFSYLGLTTAFRLPSAVAAHFNLDTLSKSVGQPVETLTYNAVPSRFLGRVRTLVEGWIQPTGMALSGLFLIVAQDRLSLPQMVGVGLLLSVLFVMVGFFKGRSYYRSLTAQLREGTLELSVVEDGLRLPRRELRSVEAMIASGDDEARTLGLELAARTGSPSLFKAVLDRAEDRDEGRRRAVTAYLGRLRNPRLLGQLEARIDEASPALQRMILEALLGCRYSLVESRLRTLMQSSDPVVATLARISDRLEDPIEMALKERIIIPRNEAAALAVARASEANGDVRLLPILEQLLGHGARRVRRKALQALARIVPEGSDSPIRLAEHLLDDADPWIRVGAVEVLGRAGDRALESVIQQLGDRHAAVRSKAAEVLGQVGEPALVSLRPLLDTSDLRLRAAVIDAVGRIGTPRAEEWLFAFLQRDYERIERYSPWLESLPADPAWQPLRLALTDANQRVLENVLRVLAALGYTRILDTVRQVLYAGNPRQRANAVEALDALPHRKFIRPLLEMLERLAAEEPAGPGRDADAKGGNNGFLDGPPPEEPPLEEIALSEDRWVCLGALAVLRSLDRPIPAALERDADELVRRFIHASQAEEDVMNRLLLLKRVSLFSDMSLDHLLVLDSALESLEFLAGEKIFAQGDLGDRFFIVQRGQVSIRAELGGEEQELTLLSVGEHFGEMALFDDSPRSAAAFAATGCTLLGLDRGRFHSLFDQLPRFGIEISRVLSARVRRLQNRLDRTLDRLRQGDLSTSDLRFDSDVWGPL